MVEISRVYNTFFFSDLPKLTTYLDSQHVEIRIAAGETLALLYELGNGLYSNTGLSFLFCANVSVSY